MSRRCIECFRTLHKKARICTNCNSYQDWRRFISIGNTTIALLIALISVLSLSSENLVKIYKNLILDKTKASFYLSLNSVYSESATITVKNTGVNEIIIPSGFICLIPMVEDEEYVNRIYPYLTNIRYPMKKEVTEVFLLSYSNEENSEHIILKPNELRRVAYSLILRRPNNNDRKREKALYPQLKDDDFVKGYCSITLEDVLSRQYTEFIDISAFDIVMQQEELKKEPYINVHEDLNKE